MRVLIGNSDAEIHHAVVAETRYDGTTLCVELDQTRVPCRKQHTGRCFGIARPVSDTSMISCPSYVGIIIPNFFSSLRLQCYDAAILAGDVEESICKDGERLKLPTFFPGV